VARKRVATARARLIVLARSTRQTELIAIEHDSVAASRAGVVGVDLLLTQCDLERDGDRFDSARRLLQLAADAVTSLRTSCVGDDESLIAQCRWRIDVRRAIIDQTQSASAADASVTEIAQRADALLSSTDSCSDALSSELHLAVAKAMLHRVDSASLARIWSSTSSATPPTTNVTTTRATVRARGGARNATKSATSSAADASTNWLALTQQHARTALQLAHSVNDARLVRQCARVCALVCGVADTSLSRTLDAALDTCARNRALIVAHDAGELTKSDRGSAATSLIDVLCASESDNCAQLMRDAQDECKWARVSVAVVHDTHLLVRRVASSGAVTSVRRHVGGALDSCVSALRQLLVDNNESIAAAGTHESTPPTSTTSSAAAPAAAPAPAARKLKRSAASLTRDEKDAWWRRRGELDDRTRALARRVEHELFGVWAVRVMFDMCVNV
jgi:hypothetical protein